MYSTIFTLAALLLIGESHVLRDEGTNGGEEVVKSKEGWALCIEKDVDAYLDKVLEKARESIQEPMRLPPRRTFVDLSEGRLWGMSSIRRAGPMKVACADNNQTVIITGELTTDEIKARYTWEKAIKSKVHSGFVLVASNDFLGDVRIVIHKNKGSHPELEKFKIQRFKKIRVEMTGLGFLSWALGEITTMMSGVFQWAIAKSIQGPLHEAIQRELWEITIE